MQQFERAGKDMDRIAGAALRKGAEIMRQEGSHELLAALSIPRKYPKRGTGELISRLGISGVQVSANGFYNVSVGFREPRKIQYAARKTHERAKRGYSITVADRGYYVATNAMVANILERGHKGSRGGQVPAKFWLQAYRRGNLAVCNAVEAELYRQLSLIFVKSKE